MRVTLFERERIGVGTSITTYAWINSNGKSPHSYHALNVAGMHAHQTLQAQNAAQGHWLDICGTVEWAAGEAAIARLSKRVAGLQQKSYCVEALSREQAANSLPDLRLPEPRTQLWRSVDEAVLCPSKFLGFLGNELRRLGVHMHENVEVLDICEHEQGIAVQLVTGITWKGDYAVSTEGRWTSQTAGMLGTSIAIILMLIGSTALPAVFWVIPYRYRYSYALT